MIAEIVRKLPPSLSEKVYYRFFCGRAAKSLVGTTEYSTLRVGDSSAKMHVVRGDVIGDSIHFTGAYEPATTRALLKIAADEGGLFIDVGANMGYYSVLWCMARESNRCVAIEASPRNLALLRRNVAENDLNTPCEIIPLAVSDRDGTVQFDQGPEAQTGWGGISNGIGSGSRVIDVETRRLDELIPADAAIRLLKIDVEGAEALVLEGAAGLLERRQVQEVWFEDNQQRREKLGISAERLYRVLEHWGYQVRRSTRDNPLPMDVTASLL